MFVVLAALAVHLVLRLVVVKGESDRDELGFVVVIAVIARHHYTGVANFHFRPGVLGQSVDAEQTLDVVGGQDGNEVYDELC